MADRVIGREFADALKLSKEILSDDTGSSTEFERFLASIIVKMPIKVLVSCEGGVIQEIRCLDPNLIDVIVADEDDISESEEDPVAYRSQMKFDSGESVAEFEEQLQAAELNGDDTYCGFLSGDSEVEVEADTYIEDDENDFDDEDDEEETFTDEELADKVKEYTDEYGVGEFNECEDAVEGIISHMELELILTENETEKAKDLIRKWYNG